MRRYHVPQFIDVEDKIFGPFTLKQFIYALGGMSVGFIMWVFLPKFLAIIVGLPIVVFGLALAFYKVNNRPFIDVITNMVSYSSQPRLYLWKKVERKKATSAQQTLPAKIPGINLPKTGKSRLDDLAWSLDVKEEFKNRN